jgi:hypothetical protein
VIDSNATTATTNKKGSAEKLRNGYVVSYPVLVRLSTDMKYNAPAITIARMNDAEIKNILFPLKNY